MNQQSARQIIDDVAMRAALWKWLTSQIPWPSGVPHITPDAPSDEIVQADLKRILFPERKLFR